jgi:hypothetical protein
MSGSSVETRRCKLSLKANFETRISHVRFKASKPGTFKVWVNCIQVAPPHLSGLLHRALEPHVPKRSGTSCDPLESNYFKPGTHNSGSRVDASLSQAAPLKRYGSIQLSSTCTAPPPPRRPVPPQERERRVLSLSHGEQRGVEVQAAFESTR